MELPEMSSSEIVELIQHQLPALFFVFSRGRTELLAKDLARDWDFLNKKEKTAAGNLIKEAETGYPGTFSGPGWHNLRRLLFQGIAYHHAGLLPPVKYLVEKLYSRHLLWVIFCTETFAAGVNFPASSAVFDSTRKWDGRDFRILHNREFFQMAGRAGRRGFDKFGHAFIRVDSRFPEQTGFFSEAKVEPVMGRLMVSPNTVLSLLRYKKDREIHRFLNDNFKMHQLKKQKTSQEKKIKACREEIEQMKTVVCPKNHTLACPIERTKARRQIKRLRLKRKKREREALKKQLASVTPKKCQEMDKCRILNENFMQAKNRLQAFKKELREILNLEKSIFREFKDVRDLLEYLGYVKDREFFPRGIFALELHVQEILVTELVFSGLLEDADPSEAAGVLAGVEYIPGKSFQEIKCDLPALREAAALRQNLLRMGVPEKYCIWSHLPGPLAYAWYNGAGFAELMEMSSLQPGDIFSIFRREIDLLRQIERAATGNPALEEKVRTIRGKLDRDEIALSF